MDQINKHLVLMCALSTTFRVGLTTGFQFLGWFFAHLVVNLIHWVLLLKRKSIMEYYCACLAQRKTHHGASVERELLNVRIPENLNLSNNVHVLWISPI